VSSGFQLNQRVKVDLSGLTIKGVSFSQNVREAPGTILQRRSAEGCTGSPTCWTSSPGVCSRGPSRRRRLLRSRTGRFTPMSEFDWAWPKRLDRPAVEAVVRLDFLAGARNVVLVAPRASARQ